MHWRTNLTLRQLARLFGVSKSAADRLIDYLEPSLALQPHRRFSKDTVLTVDGTLVPTRGRFEALDRIQHPMADGVSLDRAQTPTLWPLHSSLSLMLPTLRWVSAGRQAECRPASGCRPLDDGPFWAGETFTDSAAGVRIEVLRADGNGETVRITKS